MHHLNKQCDLNKRCTAWLMRWLKCSCQPIAARLVRAFALVWLATGAFNVALAQEESLETIDVIAEPEPQTGDVQHIEHTGTHRHISKQQLERDDINLGNILAQETGVQFRQVGGVGTLTTVTLRGASSAATDIFLDGILLNSAGNNTIDLSLLELLNLSSVDVYQGKAPAQLASSNLGGAINLRSLRADNEKPSTSVAAAGGSFNTNRLQLSHRSKYEAWDVVAAAGREASDNDFGFLNNNATPLNLDDDQFESRNNAQVVKLNGLARIGHQWSANSRSDLLLQATNRDLGIPEWLNNEDNIASFDTESNEFQLTHRLDGVGDWNTSFSLFQHNQSDRFLDQFSQIGLNAQDTQSTTQTNGIQSYWEHIGANGTFTFNTSIRNESLDSTDSLDIDNNFSVERNAILSGIQYAHFSFDERLLITPSLRVHSIDDNYDGISRLADNQRSDTVFTPQLGVRFTMSDKLTLHSTVGQYAREPSFSELFGNRGLIQGNNDLDAENGINTEFGLNYQISDNNRLNATAFASFRDELIVLVFDARGVGTSVNSGEARIYGVELENDWSINSNLSFRFNSTYQLTQNISANPALNKLELPGEARLSSFARLEFRKHNIRTWFESNYKSDFYYDRANNLPASKQWIQSAGVEYQWRKFEFGLTTNNLSDQRVEDFNGFPRPGRSFYFSLNYKL